MPETFIVLTQTTLEGLLPRGIEVVERFAPGEESDLLPEELHYVRRAVVKRRREFAAGRACARSAMSRLGVPPVAVHVAEDRTPIWPPGLVGSITHTDGYCAAAVARQADFCSVGIDTEVVGAAGAELWPTICAQDEEMWVSSLAKERQAAAVTLLFSAKEAFYKCQYPLTREWIDFHDLTTVVAQFGMQGTFQVRANRPLRIAGRVPSRVIGRFAFHHRWVSAAFALPL